MKILVLPLFAVMLSGQPTEPRLLEKALLELHGVRILAPSADLAGGYTIEELKAFGFWPPWLVRDVDRDGRPDVVAVVVRSGAAGREFGVVAIHSRTPSRLQWVVPFGHERINGVAKGPAADTVTPLFCIECDANSWFRWPGRSYEAELWAVGERIAIATYDTDHPLGLFAKPARDSKLIFGIAPCTPASVQRVAGSDQQRWYFVETRGRHPVRGWIPASFASESTCIG